MAHPNSLANLRPARRGEVRNPRGINGYTRNRHHREKFEAVCIALADCEDIELQQQLIRQLVVETLNGAVRGDSRLLLPVFKLLIDGGF